MATVENVNIEINKKLADELAALKAKVIWQQDQMKTFEAQIELRDKENEQLNGLIMMWERTTKLNRISYDDLQADKAELLEALKECVITYEQHVRYKSLLSKHQAK